MVKPISQFALILNHSIDIDKSKPVKPVTKVNLLIIIVASDGDVDVSPAWCYKL